MSTFTPPTTDEQREAALYDEKQALTARNNVLAAEIEANNKRLTEIRQMLIIKPISPVGETTHG